MIDLMTGEHTDEQGEKAQVTRYDALAAAGSIPEMVDRIVEEFNPLKIILFGSHARGDATRWSDVDLLVVFSQIENQRDTRVAIRRVLRDYPVPKDVIVADLDEIARRGHVIGSVLRPALREGKILYERS